MKYRIILEPSGRKDISDSYDWGERNWGIIQTKKWFNGLMTAIKGLAEFPERHVIAPENDEFDEEIRQLVYGRYRVLFTLRGNEVHVLHCRGPYQGKDLH
jgi:plasmid stabilization system protein ParE